jgi:hypothetical protein
MTDELIETIIAWGDDKGITGVLGKGTVSGQIDKLREEYLEIVDAWCAKDFDGLVDGIGDCFVVLTLMAERAGTTIRHCAQTAYAEIEGRTGTMVDGQFIKDKATDNLDDDLGELDPTKACSVGDETCESCQ